MSTLKHPSHVDVNECILAIERQEWQRDRAVWDAYEKQQEKWFSEPDKHDLLWRALFFIGVACLLGAVIWQSFK